ncbi:MAG: protein translocase subunit SecF, partial [Lachnospiraceae bacterium]|nr:protein translocase subunit SecF [Lachnospiraceae bacterium]
LGFDKVKFFGTKKERKTLRIVEKFPRFLCISGGLIVVGIIAIIINFATIKTPFSYGLDFSGGTATSVVFENGLPAGIQADVEKLVQEKTGYSAEVSLVNDENMVQIKTKELSTEERAALASAIESTYGISESYITTESVGSAVSSEMKRDAVVAVIVATIGMLLYIWLRFKNFNFATSAVLALVHDVLIVLVLYAVCRSFISVGNTFIACMLTIVGYSINATIVIFDRIRENIAERISKDSMLDIVNLSITQTLSRSINTSLTTFFMVFVLAILGVTSVREFAIPLMVGIICGTFSSVCLTGGLWFNLQKRFKAGSED